jgi:hypothetical protein
MVGECTSRDPGPWDFISSIIAETYQTISSPLGLCNESVGKFIEVRLAQDEEVAASQLKVSKVLVWEEVADGGMEFSWQEREKTILFTRACTTSRNDYDKPVVQLPRLNFT